MGNVDRPHNRAVTSNNRAGSLRLLCVMALGLAASLGWSQPVPDTILLPDSLGPLRPGYHLAFGSSTDDIYVASESSDIIVVDGNTFQRIKRINTGAGVGGTLLVSKHNKLYCSYPSQGCIAVVNCATNSVVGSIDVGTRPTLLCYSSGSDKLYCGDTIDKTVSVIDCASNTLLRVISVGQGLIAMVYDPTTDKVFAGTKDALLAISCSSDSIVASVSSLKWARSFCVNKRRQKLYTAAGYYRLFHDTIYVVSTRSDSVIGTLPCNDNSIPRLVCNEATDRLYGPANDGINRSWMYEYDCAADTLIRCENIGVCLAPLDIVCDTVKNKLFCLFMEQGGVLYTVDCATLNVTSIHELADPSPGVLGFDAARYRVMCTSWFNGYGVGGGLEVFDYEHDTTYTIAADPLNGWKWVLCHNPATGKLYYRWGTTAGGVGVIDERTNRVVTQSLLGQAYGGAKMEYSRTSNKFYFASDGGLGVMDGSTDRLLKVINLTDRPWDPKPCWSPVGNKVYCSATWDDRNYIAVVDCNTDSVVRTMEVYDLVKRFEYLDNGRMLCVLREALTLIDCRTDSVLVDSAIGGMETVTHTGDGEKFYAVFLRRVEVRSSSTLTLLATIDWPADVNGRFIVYSDTTHKLYWFLDGMDSVLVIDANSDTVVARLKDNISRACLDHTGRYLFCASYFDRNLRVYDTQSDSLVAMYQHLPNAWSITSNPEQHSIYVGCEDVILAYPDAPPGVEETPNGEVRATSFGPTVVRGMLLLNGLGTRSELPDNSVMSRAAQAASLMDATGRKVMDLKSGANDVRALAPGVYFVKRQATGDGRPEADVRRVVITK